MSSSLCGEHTAKIENLEKAKDDHATKLDKIDKKQWLIIIMIILLRVSYIPPISDEISLLLTYIWKTVI